MRSIKIFLLELLFASGTAAAAIDPVFVFAAGFGTCPTMLRQQSPAPDEFWQLQQETAQLLGHVPGQTIVSCFGSDGQLRPEIAPRSQMIPPATSFVEHVSLAVASQRQPALVMVGHSWGGSLVAHAVPEIRQYIQSRAGDPRFAHVQHVPILLVTIDPIDFNFCTPPALNVLRNAECMKTPSSFAPTGTLYPAITQHVRGWLNVFQTDGILLHSGPVGQFGPLGWVAVDWHVGGGLGVAPHQAIARDVRVWQAVRDWVLRFLSEAASIPY
jgi:hypothetical protein